MVDIDARRFGNGTAASESTATVWHHLLQHDYFFLSLTAIVPMSLVGFSLNMAVFWAIPVAEAVGFIRRDSRLNRLLIRRASRKRSPRARRESSTWQ